MAAGQQRNDELVALLGADLLSVDDRNCAFEAYDASGNSFTTIETHTFGTTRVNTAPSVYEWDGSVLTITEAGIYMMSFHAVVVNLGETAVAEAAVVVEEDPATGTFSGIPAFRADIAVPIVGRNSGGCTAILRVGAGYKYRVRVVRNSGTDTLALPNGGSLFNVVRLFKLR